ncbi:hypothetical protein EV182_000753 [Spiromyces aspiralis]|uniref:Uncharacterized protein n=1 Tax=Spiromyces aspiralis TaxID=68401 RepID=A0ACC1HKM7_9FUNG|nr:hypothetical protein EV182_000753 [Spiromyces aspiralis]
MFSRNGNRLSNSCKKDGRSCSGNRCNGYNHPQGYRYGREYHSGRELDRGYYRGSCWEGSCSGNGRRNCGNLRDFNN